MMNRAHILIFATCWGVALLLMNAAYAGPPELLRLTLPTPTVDISAGGVSVPVEFEFRADHPLNTCLLYITSPEGDTFFHNQANFFSQKFLAGGSTSGIFRLNLYVPPFRKAGFWRLAVQLSDSLTAKASYGDGIPGEQVPGLPMPAGSSTGITLINSGMLDSELPVLLQATVSPQTVDVTEAGGSVQVTASVSDVSGVASISVLLLNDSGSRSASASMQAAQRISGDAFQGVYQTNLSIPRLLAPGKYRLEWSVLDNSRRSRSYREESLPDPFPAIQTSIQVENTGPSDTTGPELLEISTDQTAFDVTEMAGRLLVRLQVRDAPAGLASATVSLRRVSDGANIYNAGGYTNLDGIYPTGVVSMTPEIIIPRFLPPGLYYLAVTATDASPGQQRSSRYDGTAQYPFPNGFTGLIHVANRGLVSGSKPELLSFSVTPTAQSNLYRNILLEFTAEVTDLYGARYIDAYLQGPDTRFSYLQFPLKLVAGTPQHGWWRARAYLYTDLSPGDHRISLKLVNLTDGTRIYTNGGINPASFSGAPFRINDSRNAVPLPAPWPGFFTSTGPPYPIGPLDAYQIWAMAFGGLTGDRAARHADPDGDGFPNAVEFFCGTDPLIPSHQGGPDPAADRSPRLGSTANQRWLGYQEDLRNTHLGFGTDIIIKGWKSPNLRPTSWTAVNPVFQSDRYLIYLDAPGPGRPSQFVRLSAEPSP